MHYVRIPQPCHEDWNKMTPTERGAFCKQCQIDVIDFTNKSADEIKALLLLNRNTHLCGHIKQSQLDSLNRDYIQWENQSKKTFQSKFLWACLLVFGITLFTSCETSSVELSDPCSISVELPHNDSLQSSCNTVQPNEGKNYHWSNDDLLIDGYIEILPEYYDSLE